MKLRFITSIIALAAAFCASAQEAVKPGDFDFTVATKPYLQFSNAAALSRLAVGGVSTVQVSAAKGNGAMVPLTGSDNDFEADAMTESFMRINDRIAFHGKLSYDYFTGKNMGGSILMNPSYNPVGFYESTLNNKGTKNHEYYHLIGAMSYDLNDRWALGFNFDYESGDQVKIKDPRFSNVWMELDIIPGVWFKASDTNAFGLSAGYQTTIENLVGGVYGNTDTQYFVFTDKGNMLGLVEILDGDYNYLPASSSRPMRNNFYTAALQYAHTGSFELYSELQFKYRKGEYGKRASSSPVFFEFNGLEVDYDIKSLIHGNGLIHKIGLEASYKTLGNNENSFKYVTPQGQNTIVEYNGQSHLSDRRNIDASLEYRLWFDPDAVRPSMDWGVKADFGYVTDKMTIYPITRSSNHMVISAAIDMTKNFVTGKNCFSVGVMTSFATGSGNPYTDVYAQQVQTNLKSYEDYLMIQYEYDTMSRINAGVSLGYTRFVNSHLSVFANLQDKYVRLLGTPQYLVGATHNLAVLTIGCNF